VALAEDEQPVGQLDAKGTDPPLRTGVRTPALWRGLGHLDARSGKSVVEGFGELPAAIPQQNLELLRPLPQFHQEVTGGLRGPGPVRVRGGTEDVRVPDLELDGEEHVDALERNHAVHVRPSHLRTAERKPVRVT